MHVPYPSSGEESRNAPKMNPLKAQEVLDQHETALTKLLTDEQLKRIVLLQQLKVLDLQRKRLEREMQTDTAGLDFELIG